MEIRLKPSRTVARRTFKIMTDCFLKSQNISEQTVPEKKLQQQIQ
jgi:hypothetical protein